MLIYVSCLELEGPHACVKGQGSVWWCDRYVQIVSNLEALGLQRHGVIWTLSAGHSAANIFQPVRRDTTYVNIGADKFTRLVRKWPDP